MNTRFDTESRIAVTQAADIARELGHQEVGPGHLLLGLLANPRGTAYTALRDHGLDLDTARDMVAQHHVEAAPETDEPGESTDSAEAPDYAEDREALKAIGIDLDQVREAVRANLGADVADGWAARSDRGRSRGDRRRRHRHHHDHHDHGGHEGRGRRGPRSRRYDGPRFSRGDRRRRHRHHHDHEGHEGRGRRGPRSRRYDGPRFSRALRALLRDVRRATLHDRLEAEGRDEARRIPGMTGARLLVALTRSDDPAAQAVLATATGIEGLRAQAEAATKPASTT